MVKFVYGVLFFMISLWSSVATADESKQDNVTLFGIAFSNCKIDEMQEAIIANGGVLDGGEGGVIRRFKSHGIIQDSNIIGLMSDNEGRVARLFYEFSSHGDVQKVAKVRRMIEYKYGPAHSSDGSESIGPVLHEWRLDDGVVIQIDRGWPETTTWLHYVNPKIDEVARSDLEERKRLEQKESAKTVFHAI